MKMLVKAIVLTGVLLLVPCFLAFAQESEQDQGVKNPEGVAIPREFKGYKLGTDYREYPNLRFDKSTYDYGGDVPMNRLHMPFNNTEDDSISVYIYKNLIYNISSAITHDVGIDTFNGVLQAAIKKYKYTRLVREVSAEGNTIVIIEDATTKISFFYYLRNKGMTISITDADLYFEYRMFVDYFNSNPEEYAKWKAEALLPK